MQIKSLDKKLRTLDAGMTHAKDDQSLLALTAAKANAGVAADGRELNRGSAEAAAGMGSSNGGVGSNAQPEGGGAWANLTLAEKLRARCAGNTPPAAGAAHKVAAAEAEPKRGRGRQVASKNTPRTGFDDIRDKTLCQVCKDLELAWIDRAQAIAAIHLRSGSSAKSPKINLDGLKEDTLALICADRTLATSGNRAELIARILGREGASICPHQRKRSKCKECGGAEICQHQRIRRTCKECGGADICQHQRIRRTCKECGGAGICPHQRQRSQCKECGEASNCPHQRIRSKECSQKADESMPDELEELGKDAHGAGGAGGDRQHAP